jgi:hypothetical protein
VSPPDGRDIVGALVLLYVVAVGIVFWLYVLSPL